MCKSIKHGEGKPGFAPAVGAERPVSPVLEPTRNHRVARVVQAICLAALALATGSGCVSGFCRITCATDAVPAYRLPPELLAESRCGKTPIDFTLLRQEAPKSYRIGAGDTLGIFIQGVVPTSNAEQAALYTNLNGTPDPYPATGLIRAPVVGLPLVVDENGNLDLPLIGRTSLEGVTLGQATEQLRRAYTIDHKVLNPGRDRIIVTLIKPRVQRVLIIREDTASTQVPSFRSATTVPYTKRGSGVILDLPRYENDVLHALLATGGLPGIDAYNAVWVLRSRDGLTDVLEPTLAQVQNQGDPRSVLEAGKVNRSYTRIPLRMAPGEPLSFSESDIILQAGDILYLESRDNDVFSTGGLLPGGQFPLPRDRDLDVIEAMSLVTASVGGPSGDGASSNFRNGALGGIVNPTRVIIIRKLADGQEVKIRVDLNRAAVDARERIVIQPGDFVMLQFKPWEYASNAVLALIRVQSSVFYSIP